MNSDNSKVWSSGKISSYGLKHKLSSNVLANGKELKIQITIWNESNQTATSDFEIFQTSSRPIITLSPLSTVNSFSYNFQATYSQLENTPLRNYTVFLYDKELNLIDKSPIKTERTLEYLFSNLQSEQYYHIEFQAISSKGLIGTTGKVKFYCFYYRPKMNVNLQAKNIENAGIELTWYITQIIGLTDNAKFINNEKINTRDGSKVWFDEGFSTDKDFTLKLWLESPLSKENLIRLTGTNGSMRLVYDSVFERFIFYKINNNLETTWQSNIVNGNSYVVTIQQINKDINITSIALN